MPREPKTDSVAEPVTSVTAAPEAAKTTEPVVLLAFDRWFALTGRAAHHKLGMLAFIKGREKGKRTKASWDSLFQGY